MLLRSPSTIKERNLLGQSPLHLAYDWYCGVELLLCNGCHDILNDEDHRNILPLAYALEAESYDVAKLLVQAGSRLSSTSYARGGEELLAIPSQRIGRLPLEFLDFTVQTIYSQRSLLQQLAANTLSMDEWQSLAPTDGSLSDDSAFKAQNALLRCGIEIPPSLMVCSNPRSETVYHIDYLSVQAAQQLYDLGFRDIDQPDINGCTPLMIVSYCPFSSIELKSWFISTGADISYTRKQAVDERCAILGNTGAAHNVCLDLARSSPFQHPTFEHWNVVMTSTITDGCQCACSSKGCLPITVYFRASSTFRNPTWSDDHRDKAVKCVDEILKNEKERAVGEISGTIISLEIIRFYTFEKLSLTHTCSTLVGSSSYKRCGTEDINHTLDIERQSLDKLEDLMVEFAAKLEKLDGTLKLFLAGHWSERMEEIEKEERAIGHDFAKVRELGVSLKDEEEEEEEEEEKEEKEEEEDSDGESDMTSDEDED
jgi:hypothetical protein